jgi:hypothetical protein
MSSLRKQILMTVGGLLLTVVSFLHCDDSTFKGVAPKVENSYTGPSATPPSFMDYLPLPDSDELAIDFGRVDVQTIARRYLFLRNEGQGDLKLIGAEFEAGSSSDFLLACRQGGQFVEGCAFSATSPLVVAPGMDLAIEVMYAPAEIGTDTGAFTLRLNTEQHHELKVRLTGEGVTPEIQVCILDCTGDELGDGCTSAAELCDDQMGKDNLVLLFGSVPVGSSVNRNVIIRNLGRRELQVTGVVIADGDVRQFSKTIPANDLPGVLNPASETFLTVSYAPDAGQPHSSRLQIASSDSSSPEINVVLNGQGIAPLICIEPTRLDFGTVVAGVPVVHSFKLTNCGLMPLEIYNFAMQQNPPSSPDFSLVSPPTATLTLEPDQFLDVAVQYFPQTGGSDAGGVDIFSNDARSDPTKSFYTGTVELLGNASALVCDIEVVPVSAEFGVVEIDASPTVDLAVNNKGNGPCLISSTVISRNSVGNEFSLTAAPPDDTTLAAGASTTVQVAYTPVDLGQDAGVLSLFVNDKDTGEVRMDLNAFGKYPGTGPVAVCSVTPVSAVSFERLTWHGDQSYDTNGHPLTTYTWTIVSFPPGSAATLTSSLVASNRLTQTDLAGTYSAQLVVTNDIGQVSQPCIATATVTPSEDLWIEMFWAHSGDDMDLHLLAPGGIKRSSKDCYFANCIGFHPDWGVIGDRNDNPGLDLDDIPGTGPENINILKPAAGLYTVFVHDYPMSVYDPANNVTVKVYIAGALVATFNRDIAGEDTDWDVCTIDWPSGTITPL